MACLLRNFYRDPLRPKLCCLVMEKAEIDKLALSFGFFLFFFFNLILLIFFTVSTSIPHDLLKSHMSNIINDAFKHKNGAARTLTSKLTEIKAISPMIL